MNFLAHLHLAWQAKSSLLGNLVADFVRGDPFRDFSPDVADGIMLHRRIDNKVDQLAEVKQARQLFKPNYYRISAITLDIAWDHLLALNWTDFVTDMTLNEFMTIAQQQVKKQLWQAPDEFQKVNHYLWQERWLENYADINFIAEVLLRMEKRRPKLQGLSESIICVRNNYEQLDLIFRRFYPDLLKSVCSI